MQAFPLPLRERDRVRGWNIGQFVEGCLANLAEPGVFASFRRDSRRCKIAWTRATTARSNPESGWKYGALNRPGDRTARLQRYAPPPQGHLHRLGGQPDRMVRFLRLRGLRPLFRKVVLSRRRRGRAAAQRGHAVRLWLPSPPSGRLAVRAHRGPPRTAHLADDFCDAHVPGLVRHRRHAHLRKHRRHGARHPGGGPRPPGAQPRRRIRHERHLLKRGSRREEPRILLKLPIRHAHRRPALRDPRAIRAAAMAADARAVARVGLAHSFRDRRPARDLRRDHAQKPRRDRLLPRRREEAHERKLAPRTGALSSRDFAGGRPDHGRHGGLLHLHNLHAEVPEALGSALRTSRRRPSRPVRWCSPWPCSPSTARCPTASAANGC